MKAISFWVIYILFRKDNFDKEECRTIRQVYDTDLFFGREANAAFVFGLVNATAGGALTAYFWWQGRFADGTELSTDRQTDKQTAVKCRQVCSWLSAGKRPCSSLSHRPERPDRPKRDYRMIYYTHQITFCMGTGRYPLFIKSAVKCIKYWTRGMELPSSRLCWQTCDMLLAHHSKGRVKYAWTTTRTTNQ